VRLGFPEVAIDRDGAATVGVVTHGLTRESFLMFRPPGGRFALVEPVEELDTLAADGGGRLTVTRLVWDPVQLFQLVSEVRLAEAGEPSAALAVAPSGAGAVAYVTASGAILRAAMRAPGGLFAVPTTLDASAVAPSVGIDDADHATVACRSGSGAIKVARGVP
jgi:hypothetical protein